MNHRISLSFLLLIACITTAAMSTVKPANASALKTINNPGGGMIVYGPVDGQSTKAGAMGAILKNLHNQYGNRPQVGRVFRVKGTDSDAAFFTLEKKQDNKRVAGLVIAAETGPNRVEAALLSDDASRFAQTVNPMMKTLFAQWHPVSAGSAKGSAQSAPAAASMKRFTVKDGTASVELPDGWKLDPSSGGGTIFATGPNGEAANLGFPLNAMNSNDPKVQKTMQFAQGAGRNTSYAKALYYPYGGDLGRTMTDLMHQFQQKRGLPTANIKVEHEEAFPSARGRCAHITGHSDPNDGKGLREFNSVFCVGPLTPMGQYSATLFSVGVPNGLADRERTTATAILGSFQEDMAKIQAQANTIAAPEIARINQIGRQAAAQAAQAHAAEDAHNRSVEQRWDSQDKQNQAFSNYLLDQTVVLDKENNAHGTLWNQEADALVKSDPNRYEYVNAPNYWKGIDY
jgi:hypothetical protein